MPAAKDKWKNLRDSFVRERKKKGGGPSGSARSQPLQYGAAPSGSQMDVFDNYSQYGSPASSSSLTTLHSAQYPLEPSYSAQQSPLYNGLQQSSQFS